QHPMVGPAAASPGRHRCPPKRSFCAGSPGCARLALAQVMRRGKKCDTGLAKGGWMPKPRILVVDDEANARAALRTILSEEGYEIAEAPDGEAGLSTLTEISPDVVLADVRMPRMAGLTFLRKAKEQGSAASFVMMTAFASVEAAVEAMRSGAENYLVKPLDVNSVLVFLEKALEKRKLVREAAGLRERVRERYRLEGMGG